PTTSPPHHPALPYTTLFRSPAPSACVAERQHRQMLPFDHIIQLSGTASGESDLDERSRTTHGERDALLDTSRHEVVREVIRVSVGALNADTALAVHSAALGEVAHDRHASVNRRRNNSAQAPDGRVFHDRTARVLTLEEATTVVLTVPIAHEAKFLVVSRVDDQRIGAVRGFEPDLGHRAEDRIRVVVGVSRRLGLDSTVADSDEGASGAITVQQLVLLHERQLVEATVVDLRHD